MSPALLPDPRKEFPVQVKSVSSEVQSLPTSITIQNFANQVLIFVSQLPSGNLGSFLEVTQDKPAFDTFDPASNTFTVKSLFGADTQEIELAARIFGGALNLPKPIVFAIALKDFSKNNLNGIKDCLVKLWSS